MFYFDGLETVHNCIGYQCNRDPEAHCFSIFQRRNWQAYSRAEFWQQVEYWATLFANVLPESSLVLFVKKIDIHLLAAYIGAMKAGHLPAQISYLSAKTTGAEYNRKINHILDTTGARAIFTDESQRALFDKQTGLQLFTPQSKVEETSPGKLCGWPPANSPQRGEDGSSPPPRGGLRGGRDPHLPSGLDFLSSLLEGIKGGPTPPQLSNPQYALVQFSSGSTGLQKGVVLTHAGIIAHMKNYSAVLELSETDSIVSWLPLYHDMGLIACYLMPLMCGIPVYQIDPFAWILQPDVLLQAIEKHRATICFLPNFAYHLLANKGKAHDLSSMRLFINCSEPAREAAHKQFCEKYPSLDPDSLTVCYALAENTFAVSQSLPRDVPALEGGKAEQDVISCGRVIPGTEVKIFDPNQEGEGEIGIKGDCLFHRFTDGTLPLRDGFYLTGDLGFLDDGHLFITGRKKDIVIVHGKNIYPQDIEYVASNVPGVYPGRVVAFGIENRVAGSEELIVIVETDGAGDLSQVRQAIQKAIYAEVGILPKRVEVVAHMTLVKTSSGKISRTRNKELYQNKALKVL